MDYMDTIEMDNVVIVVTGFSFVVVCIRITTDLGSWYREYWIYIQHRRFFGEGVVQRYLHVTTKYSTS